MEPRCNISATREGQIQIYEHQIFQAPPGPDIDFGPPTWTMHIMMMLRIFVREKQTYGKDDSRSRVEKIESVWDFYNRIKEEASSSSLDGKFSHR